MKKLIIKVTPEQSRIAQEILFKAGYSWARSGVTVANTSGAYLALSIFKDKALTYSSSLADYADGIEVIQFADWFKKYNPIEKQRAKVAKHQAKLDLMIQEKIAADLKNSKVELKGGAWTVVRDRSGNYLSTNVNPFATPFAIRMTEECAKQLADDLNSGRFTLDLP